MASTFKTLLNNDVVSTRTMLHEAIPLTGTIVSGTYGDNNIKNYTHGMFESVYDYPYLSSSANHVFDLTIGFSPNSGYSASSPTSTLNPQQAKKINIYNEMAQVLAGYDVDGNIRQFDQDGDLSGGTKVKECIFINFARLLSKDEIKKGSFSLTVLTGGLAINPSGSCLIQDVGGLNAYKINSPAGEYGLLYSGSYYEASPSATGIPAGLVFYQAGICVLTASLFDANVQQPAAAHCVFTTRALEHAAGNLSGSTVEQQFTGSYISASCDTFRNRFVNVSFNNTTELNSTIYFCL